MCQFQNRLLCSERNRAGGLQEGNSGESGCDTVGFVHIEGHCALPGTALSQNL